jgi:hypothetical protein
MLAADIDQGIQVPILVTSPIGDFVPNRERGTSLKRRFTMKRQVFLIMALGSIVFVSMELATASFPAYSEQSESAATNICPVTGKKIEMDKGVRVTVNGHDYLVFDQASAEELKANPDKYLEPDGTPKNAKK